MLSVYIIIAYLGIKVKFMLQKAMLRIKIYV